ncbi:Tat pathway signal sequence domain protein 14 [Achromobacter xylosoxidans A8]|uniref:Tat pathway signal sequence domain protein 14 n=1 Tax=Achromobacter xylosoxidans (strain A8) TaxID=762376 RepID=E3HEM0_ACHXA|nr:tripartite tricarboxylate transporter substrate binding protein [Achromobacter xylosoxidans]ADP16429.1 Tat pathway signal sequence domain protein 14 [Achromobacter xylosoxidans A8]
MSDANGLSRLIARRRVLRAVACTGALCAVPALGQAKQLVPFFGRSSRKPVRLVVPFAAGGTTDIVARLLAAHLPAYLGQTVIVENRPGAGGNIGVASVAKADPDGGTLLLVSSSFVTKPAIARERPAYDPMRDFAPVSLAVSSPDVIVVRAESGLATLKDLLDAAARSPGTLTYATPGNGNSVHLAAELLWRRAGVTALHVPYSGAAPAVVAALGGQVDCAFSALPAAQAFLAEGKLRALAVGGEERWPALSGVPTIAQAGFADFRSETIQALFAPAGTPAATVERVNKAVADVLGKEPVRKQLDGFGFRVVASSAAELQARVAQEVPKWAAVASQAGISAD